MSGKLEKKRPLCTWGFLNIFIVLLNVFTLHPTHYPPPGHPLHSIFGASLVVVVVVVVFVFVFFLFFSLLAFFTVPD